MKSTYGQYCPLALSAELLCRRWTILVISRLLDGCCQFNEIHQGIPRISPSLLSQRLSELEDAGLVYKQKLQHQKGYSYHLTEAGLSLDPIIMGMSVWGQQWARDMVLDDLDIGFLAWSMHLRMNVGAMPPGRTVIEFLFPDAPTDCRNFWLVHEDGKVDMCLKYPGYDTDLLVTANILNFVEMWRGFRDLKQEIKAKTIRLSGPSKLRKEFPNWLLLSYLAEHERLKEGKERTLSTRIGLHSSPAQSDF